MSVNFKALGGMFEFRYINKVEDLDLDDLCMLTWRRSFMKSKRIIRN